MKLITMSHFRKPGAYQNLEPQMGAISNFYIFLWSKAICPSGASRAAPPEVSTPLLILGALMLLALSLVGISVKRWLLPPSAPVSTGYGYQVMLFRASCSDPGILPRQAEPGNDELAGVLGETKSFFFWAILVLECLVWGEWFWRNVYIYIHFRFASRWIRVVLNSDPAVFFIIQGCI